MGKNTKDTAAISASSFLFTAGPPQSKPWLNKNKGSSSNNKKAPQSKPMQNGKPASGSGSKKTASKAKASAPVAVNRSQKKAHWHQSKKSDKQKSVPFKNGKNRSKSNDKVDVEAKKAKNKAKKRKKAIAAAQLPAQPKFSGFMSFKSLPDDPNSDSTPTAATTSSAQPKNGSAQHTKRSKSQKLDSKPPPPQKKRKLAVSSNGLGVSDTASRGGENKKRRVEPKKTHQPRETVESFAEDSDGDDSVAEADSDAGDDLSGDAMSDDDLSDADSPQAKPVTDSESDTHHWFDEAIAFPGTSSSKQIRVNFDAKVAESAATDAYDMARDIYVARTKSSASVKFFENVMKQGTINDKIYKMTLMVQEQPEYRLNILDSLLTVARKKSRRESELATKALKDLFMSSVLPDRKLKYFDAHEFHVKHAESELVAWHFEDQLKRRYVSFISIIEEGLKDNLSWYQLKMMTMVLELLSGKPENEQMLLSILVNKLTDRDKKTVSRASYLLRQLLSQHPGMKIAVANEIERMVHRPNISMRAQYNGINFLNQILFNKHDVPVASKLISVYLNLFQSFLSSKSDGGDGATRSTNNEVNSKMLSAILSGVNRAYPFAKLDDEVFDQHTDVLFRVIHTATFNVAVQALTLLFQVMSSRSAVSDRFYRALYDMLLTPTDLAHSSKKAMCLNLLFRAIKADVNMNRVAAFAKRLLQICLHSAPNIICGVLLLLSELAKHHQSLKMLISHSEYNEDEDGHEVFVKKEEPEVVVKEEEMDDADFVDDFEVEEDSVPEPKALPKLSSSGLSNPLAVQHRSRLYDPKKRDPQFANAQYSCLWELRHLRDHFHPSVSKFADSLLRLRPIDAYSGDPLEDFTNSAFLDRFSYRKPKKIAPSAKSFSDRKLQRFTAIRDQDRLQPVNTRHFLEKSIDEVAFDQRFYHQYFSRRAEKRDDKISKKLAEGEADQDEEAFAMNLFEKELEREIGEPVDIDDKDDDDLSYLNDLKTDGQSDDDDDDAADVASSELLEKMFGSEETDGFHANPFGDSDDEDMDGEDDDDDDAVPNKAPSGLGDSPFAGAEEFAEILERSASGSGSGGRSAKGKQQRMDESDDDSGDDDDDDDEGTENRGAFAGKKHKSRGPHNDSSAFFSSATDGARPNRRRGRRGGGRGGGRGSSSRGGKSRRGRGGGKGRHKRK